MPESNPRFTRRMTATDQLLGSVIVDSAGEVLPSAAFNLVAGGVVLKCSVVEVGCRCDGSPVPHHHKVLSAEGLPRVIDVRAGNIIVLRRDDGLVSVEETAFAVR